LVINQRLLITDPALPQKEDLNKLGNLTENSIKMLESRKRRRRNPTVAMGKEDTNLSTDIPLNHQDQVASNIYPDIWDGEIDINSNYTGFIEIIGKCYDSIYCLQQYYIVFTF